MRVDNSTRSGSIIRISLIFYNMKVYCVFILESPHRGDSNEYTQYTIFQYEKEKHRKLSQICSCGIFSKGLKNEFERAVVNEPAVFEPLKFYCIQLNLDILNTDIPKYPLKSNNRVWAHLHVLSYLYFSTFYLKLLILESKFSGTRKFTF